MPTASRMPVMSAIAIRLSTKETPRRPRGRLPSCTPKDEEREIHRLLDERSKRALYATAFLKEGQSRREE
jgi:hypothetical protein